MNDLLEQPIKEVEETAKVGQFSLRPNKGPALTFRADAAHEVLAMQWTYTVRNRNRWEGVSEHDQLHEQAMADLRSRLELVDCERGLNDDEVDRLKRADRIEVGFEADHPDRKYLRHFPWEYWLWAATRSSGGRPLFVSRQLETDRPKQTAATSNPTLIIESAPGKVRSVYGFDSEARIVGAGMSSKPDVQPNLTLDKVKAYVKEHEPSVIHVGGINAYEGCRLLWPKLWEENGANDTFKGKKLNGMIFTDDYGDPVIVEAEEIAEALNAGKRSPALVTFNIYNSAAEMAALSVAEGAAQAIGIQDKINDALAELFFTTFYRLWDGPRTTTTAFEAALDKLRSHRSRLRGSGMSLWSSNSLIDDQPKIVKKDDHAPRKKEVAKRAKKLADTPLASQIEVEPRPYNTINYALLHNDQNFFKSFKLRNLVDEDLNNIRVEVTFFVGAQQFPFRGQFQLLAEDPIQDIADHIRLPLTWEFVSSLQESIRTGLSVQVEVDGEVVHLSTHPVNLLPTNEWRDNRKDGVWLPSFVFPRDPAISQLINEAEQHLRTILDNGDIGFIGYENDDPTVVYRQVRAVWCALAFNANIAYAPPPPTYSKASQRLRTPSDIIRERRGTCIDLSLLLCACLEFVDIDPVIFLTKGHAMAGFWRNEESRKKFHDTKKVLLTREGKVIDTKVFYSPNSQQVAWVYEKDSYEQVIAAVRDDSLVPIEAKGIALRQSFRQSLDDGIETLADADSFDSLLDIRSARTAGNVTPLPLVSTL